MKLDNYKKLISESEEQDACLDLLNQVGFIVNRMNTGAMKINNPNGKDRFIRFNEPGYPDIAGYTKSGKAFYWEVKRKGGKPTDKQKEFIDKAKKYNCIAGIGTCCDLEYELRKRGYLR